MKDDMLVCHNHENAQDFKDFYLHSKPQLKLSLKNVKENVSALKG